MKKTALITGVTGQDGSYLSEFLLSKKYAVHGFKRKSSSFNTNRVNHLVRQTFDTGEALKLHYADLTDFSSLVGVIRLVQPDEIYNLAAQSHVQVSFDLPEYTANTNALGTLRLLEAIRILGMEKKIRFYQASSSEQFGKVQAIPQNENTPFYPRSPYAVSKVFAYWITKNYRESYDMFACNGILFNHESPRRGETFVTRKITRAVAAIHLGKQECLYLGNLDAERDWGFAKEYVEGMWLMLQQEKPDDYVLASGRKYTVRYFAELAFKQIGKEIEWKGSGLDEVGVEKTTGKVLIRVSKKYFRPADVDLLLGDATMSQKKLQWKPRFSIQELAELMVESDLQSFKQ